MAENLKEALSGDDSAFQELHRGDVVTAMDKGATLSYSNAMEVEEVHPKLYGEALKRVASGEDVPEEEIFVCSVCGNTVLGKPPESCPVCGAPSEKFDEVA